MIAAFPLTLVALVLFIVLLAVIVNGRFWSAIVGVGGFLLVIGAALLFGGLLLARPDAGPGPPPPLEQLLPLPRQMPRTARPYETVARRMEPSPVELPEPPASGPTDKAAGSAEASTDEPPGPRRPAWMDAPMGRVDGVYRTRVTTGFWMSRTECERELPNVLRDAVATYADQLLGEGKAKLADLPMSYILGNIVHGEWEERRQDTIHTLFSLHELLEFDRDANQMIEASYRRSVVQGRLGYVSAGSGALLGLLTILFGYLKLDTLTRGYYTGRLRLTAAAAILALAVVAGLLVMA